MSYYDFNYYEELSEFDMQVKKFKSSLVSSMREEFLDEMVALIKENEELREFRGNKKKYEQELREAKAEYQRKIEEAERNANNKKAKDLLRTFSVIGYRANPEYKQGPMGRNMTEKCSCAKETCIYSPKEVKLLRFHAGKEIVDTYFEQVGVDEVYDSYSLCAQIYDKTKKPFVDINWVYTVFLQEDDCQKYCDWLNKAVVESIPHECKTCVYHTVFFNGCTLDHDCTNPDGGCSNNYDRWRWRGQKED